MFLQGPLLLVLSSVLVVSTTPFPSAGASPSKFAATLDITTPLHPSNASFSSLDITAENSLTIHCDGGTYGFNPSIRDCESISEQLTPNDRILTFQQRSFDNPPGTAPLPLVLMGDQALCYTQAVPVGSNPSAKASITMIRDAAAALVRQCARGPISQGGIATNIGGDNRLAVVLGTYDREPTCSEESASWQICRHILPTMPADYRLDIFGPEANYFKTPFRMPSGIHRVEDRGCTATIDTVNGAYDATRFYDMYWAVVAIYAVCARRNKGGVIRGLGREGHIYVTMSADQTLELPSNTTNTSVIGTT